MRCEVLSSLTLLISTVVCAHAIPQNVQKPLESVKNKRQLNYYNDIISPPPPQHINNLAHIKRPAIASPLHPHKYHKFTNVFGFDDISYQHIFNELNGYGYPTNIPTHITPPIFETPSIYSNGYGYVNYGATNNVDAAYVTHDGRIVKQYSVHEQHHNDLPNSISLRPTVVSGRAIPSQVPIMTPHNFAQPRTFNVNGNNVPTFLNKNHGVVALGSGGLGIYRGSNGEVYLGSGSLGYINHLDHYNNVVDIVNRRQKSLTRGPTMF